MENTKSLPFHIKDKINESTKKETEFYDVAESYNVLPKFNVRVTPQLEKIDFYHGGRILEQQDYHPQSFATRRKLVHQRQERVRKNVQLSEIFDNFKEGQICFVGPAGSGKTTLLKALSRDVIEGKYENLREIEFVHFVKCRDFAVNEEVTPGELFFRNLSIKIIAEEMSATLAFARRYPNKVLFVIDSLDTLPYRIENAYRHTDLYGKSNPPAILWNLLTGRLIPHCRIITSSREHAIRDYEDQLRAQRVIALVGLTTNAMKKIIAGYLNEEVAEETMHYLETKSPTLKSLCSTPVFLVFTLIGREIKSDFEPCTMTGIMVLLLQSLLRSPHAHVENIKDVIDKLKHLSFTGTNEGRVLFRATELQDYNLKEEEVTDVAILAPGERRQRLLEGDILLFFCHQSIQETLTAFYIAEMDLDEFKQFVSKNLHKPQYCVIRRILCGILLDEDVLKASEQLLTVDGNLQLKKDILQKSIEAELERTKHNRGPDRLELFISIREAGDGLKDFTKRAVSAIVLMNLPLSISDVHALSSIVQHCSKMKRVWLWGCSLDARCLKVFASCIKNSDVQISKFDLGCNDLDIDAMLVVGDIAQQCHVDSIDLQDCNLSTEHLRIFEKNLNDVTLSELDLRGNILDPTGASVVGQIAKKCKVGTLNLFECNCTSKHLLELKSSLASSKIEVLEIGYFGTAKKASHDDILAVVDLLPNITKELNMRDTEVEIEDQQIILKSLHKMGSTDLKVCFGSPFDSRIITGSCSEIIGHDSTIRQSETQEIKECIGPEGGTIKFGGCDVIFPPDAVKRRTEFSLLLSVNYELWKVGLIGITPKLSCKPSMKFLKSVKIRLLTWCSTAADNVIVDVLRNDDEENEDWNTLQQIKLNSVNDNIIEFECDHFSDFLATIRRIFFGEVSYQLDFSLYYQTHGNFQLVIHALNSLVKKKTIEELNERGFKPAPVLFNAVSLPVGEQAKLELRCISPEKYRFDPQEEIFILKRNFTGDLRAYIAFRLISIPEENEAVIFECRVGEERPYKFNLLWPRKEMGSSLIIEKVEGENVIFAKNVKHRLEKPNKESGFNKTVAIACLIALLSIFLYKLFWNSVLDLKFYSNS